MGSTVFVSYSHADSGWVRGQLVRRLRSWGLSVLIDYESFDPGTHLVDAISDGIRRAQHVLFVVSEGFCRSEWSRKELKDTIFEDPAVLKRKAVPIVLNEAAVPPELRSLVWCNLSKSAPAEREWRKLCRALGGVWSPTAPADVASLQSLAVSGRTAKERLGAIRAVALEEGVDALDWLETVLWENKYDASRREALRQIVHLAHSNSLPLLKTVVAQHSSPPCRWQALEHYFALSGLSDMRFVLRLLETHHDYGIRLHVTGALLRATRRGSADRSDDRIALTSRLQGFAQVEQHPAVKARLIAVVCRLSQATPTLKDWILRIASSAPSTYYRANYLAIGLTVLPQDPDLVAALQTCVELKDGFGSENAKTFLGWVSKGEITRLESLLGFGHDA